MQGKQKEENKVPKMQMSVRIPTELKLAFTGKVKGQGSNLDAVVEDLLRRYLAGEFPGPGGGMVEMPRYRNEEWHDFLDVILDSGIREATEAIQSNLRMFAFTVHVGHGKSPDEIQGILRAMRKSKKLRRTAKQPENNTLKNRAG